MKKVLSAAALALVVAAASQVHAQGGGVRVGPAADEAVPRGTTTPKKEEKKVARPPQVTPPAAQPPAKGGGEQAQPPAAEAKKGEETGPKKGEEKKEEAGVEKPAGALPANTATAAPVETSTPSVTTDAPAKLPANGVVPVAPPPTDGGSATSNSSTNTSAPSSTNTSAPASPSNTPPSGPAANTSPAASSPSTDGAPPSTTNGQPPPSTAGAEKASPTSVTEKPSAAAEKPSAVAEKPSTESSPSSPPSAAATSSLPPTSIYRIGTGDVLDVRLLNQAGQRESTLFTVMTGGILEYPLAGDPLVAEWMTPEELGAKLAHELKRRAVYEQPQVVVSVREYASHAVLVSGLANDPGTKIIRREAIPLYVLIAEAQPKPEAGRALVISHRTGKSASVDLSDAAALNMLVHPGDVVTLATRPREYFYVGGEVNAPGQKDFHAGLTLTQAVLASGGVTRSAGRKVRVLRQGADGRLVPADYNLREIEEGKVPDPVLQAGDRVEVSRDR